METDPIILHITEEPKLDLAANLKHLPTEE